MVIQIITVARQRPKKTNTTNTTNTDDGCGIPEERLPDLFTGLLGSEAPVDSTRNNMGIGLSVCNTIIKAHGGEFQAGNRRSGGAFFRFALELEENIYV